MQHPDKETRAWDPSLYKYGQLYVAGYANPIKPKVNHNQELENPDTIDVTEGDGDATEDQHVSLISSSRYREYMRQDLISQLLNPREQWRLIVYGIIALGILQFVGMLLTMYGTGAF